MSLEEKRKAMTLTLDEWIMITRSRELNDRDRGRVYEYVNCLWLEIDTRRRIKSFEDDK